MNQDELLQTILHELQGLKETVTSTDIRLKNVEQEVQGLKETVTSNTQELQGLKETVTSNVQELQGLKETVTSNTQELQGLKEIATSTDIRLKKIELVQENVTNKNIQILLEGQTGINDKFQRLDSLEEKVEDIQMTVSVLKALTVKK